MKRLKNNKGVTGVDIAISVTMIVITLGVAMAIYTAYSNKTKEVKRNTTATNLAMKVIETVEDVDISNDAIPEKPTDGNNTTEINIDDSNKVKYDIADIPTGYTIKLTRKKSEDDILANLAFEVDVTVTYKVKDKEKSVTLSTIKKYDEVEEAEKPDMEDTTIYGCIPVKYVASKNGYVKTNYKDEEWYSISSKIFPIVANATDNDFDRNGVIQLSECSEIYVWVPSYCTDSNGKYRFCSADGKIIQYVKNETTNIATYELSEMAVSSKMGGYWQKINSEQKPVDVDGNEITDSENAFYKLKNNLFTWE
ncbi:MAG: hypothetical protein ACI4UE_01925 [Candidatus Scatovivens sp.]